MLILLNEEKNKKVNDILNILLNNNFYYKNRFLYCKESKRISDIYSLLSLFWALNIDIQKIDLLMKFIEIIQDFFWETKKIKVFKYKGNFKNKKSNWILFNDIENYILLTNEKYLILKNIKKINIEFIEKEIEVLNKKEFKRPIIKKIILNIIETWKIFKNDFYYMLSKSPKNYIN